MLRCFLILTVVVAGLGLVGCAEEKDKTPTSTQPPTGFETPAQGLQKLAGTFTTARSIDDYKEMLMSTYTFYFDPNDIGKTIAGGYVIPTSWTRDQDVTATTNMFSQAYDIELTFLNLGDLETDPAGTTYEANNVLMQCYLFPDGPDFAYLATGPCDFTFEKVGNLWYIKSWSDRTSSDNNETSTFGAIRAMYR
jgi:hypothetical protein